MLPNDFTTVHGAAVLILLAALIGYSWILRAFFARGSLNSQLSIVRTQWMELASQREAKPFDAVLLGHISNSVAFFGSATLLVLAGIITTLARVESLHGTISALPFTEPMSITLFALLIGFLGFVLALCFFSFTYALRKLIYTIALIGALPEKQKPGPEHDILIEAAATVMTEAIRSFNFGIRGYYYAVAALCMFISPWASIAMTVLMTAVLIYRQIGTRAARAIQRYVEALKSSPPND